MPWLDGKWSDTYVVAERGERAWNVACREVPGVYRLVALSEPWSPIPQSLNRVCGTDGTGTIYIGQGSVLQNRVAQLVMQHRPDNAYKGHIPLSSKMAELFGEDRLGVCWEFSSEAPEIREWNLLKAYVDEFGELPPLNSQRGRSQPVL